MKKVILGSIRFYQKNSWFHKNIFKTLFLSDQACRFTPSCSEYSYKAIDKYGIIIGSFKSLKRVIKCNPWNKGGEDPLR